MSGLDDTLCFTCGLPLGDPPRLNHLPNGRVCPTCRDRLLDALPPLLPGQPSGEPAAAPEAELVEQARERSGQEPRPAGPRAL